MSGYPQTNDVLSLATDGGLVLPVDVARTPRPRSLTVKGLAPTAGRRLWAAVTGVGSCLARFVAAGQLGAGDARERGRWTGARC